MLPKHLVLSGGGVKVISLVGALIILEDGGNLKNVKKPKEARRKVYEK